LVLFFPISYRQSPAVTSRWSHSLPCTCCLRMEAGAEGRRGAGARQSWHRVHFGLPRLSLFKPFLDAAGAACRAPRAAVGGRWRRQPGCPFSGGSGPGLLCRRSRPARRGLPWERGHWVPACPAGAARILPLPLAATRARKGRRRLGGVAGGRAGRSVPLGAVACPCHPEDPAWPCKPAAGRRLHRGWLWRAGRCRSCIRGCRRGRRNELGSCRRRVWVLGWLVAPLALAAPSVLGRGWQCRLRHRDSEEGTRAGTRQRGEDAGRDGRHPSVPHRQTLAQGALASPLRGRAPSGGSPDPPAHPGRL